MSTAALVNGLVLSAALCCLAGCRGEPGGGGGSALAPPRHLDETSPQIDQLVESQRKRIMGRRASLRDVRRIVEQTGALVERALRDPAVQADLQALAHRAGIDVATFRRYFQWKQEADLLLESGGDPDAVSVSYAVGAAQFLAGTARRCGLRVNEAAARECSRRMAHHREAIRWLESQPGSFAKPAPDWASGARWSRDQWCAYHQRRWQDRYGDRRRHDERYDPARAIAAQTRYLLRLARRYGGMDWALQAYHGGEGGVNRTVNLFLHASASMRPLPGPLLARLRGPGRLSYARLYFAVTPLGEMPAFNYLYGRADDHRYYWWKVLMAERAIAAYRQDPGAFERQWQALRPGQRTEAVWYPDRESKMFADLDALRTAYRSGELLIFASAARGSGIRTADLASLDRQHAGTYKGLRPEAMGALMQIARLYRRHGGKGFLTVVGMTTTERYSRALVSRYPEVRPHGVRPGDWKPTLDYHPTGLCFDLRPPQQDWNRKVLAYALSQLADRQRISWLIERIWGPERWHVVPNPAYREELTRDAQRQG